MRKKVRPDAIAKIIGTSTPTVYRELKRGYNGELDDEFNRGYSAALGEKRVKENFRKRGRRKNEQKKDSL